MAATSEIPASSQKDPCFQLNLNSSLMKPPVAALNYNCATLQKVALKQITVKEEVSVSDGTVSAIYQKKPSSTTGSCSVPSPFEPIQELDSLKKSGKPSKEQLVDGCQGIPMKLHDGWLHPLLAHEAALEKSLKPINGQLVNGCSSITIEMQDGCFGPLPIELTQELAPLEKSGKANKGKMVNERSGISAKMQNVCLGPLPIEPIQELADLEKSGKPSKGQLVDGRSDVPTIVQDGYKDHLPIELTQELLSLEKSGKPTQMQLVDGGSGIPAKMGDLSCPKFASANNILGSRSSLEDSPEVCLEYPTNSSESCDLNRSLKLVDIVVGGFDGSCNEQEGHGMQVNGGLTSQSSANQYQSAPVCVNCRSLCVEAKESFLTAAAHGSESVSNTGGSVKVSGQNGNLAGSGKSSICSTGSDVSDESSSSSFSGSMSKPHKANDSRWEAIQAIRLRDGALGMNHFRLLKRLGCGDIGSVYLSELSGTRSYFAMKVMDKDALASRKKLLRAQTEREILQSLDHPFLPTLYTHFETEKFSCLVMEFCPGGDLHVLRQRQPGKHFSEHAAKFYVAEVLLSLEYLHMLGIIYRDLKPENVLVRDDGHIMLSDFDLSLRCAVSPTLVRSSNTDRDVSRNLEYCVQPSCIEPTCAIQPSCIQPTCFAPRFLSSRSKKEERKAKPKDEFLVRPLPELIAEPTSARSMSFVGTHEYLAPEIIKGEGHGSAVDWWTFGIFLYELLFGRTPFKGSGNRATLFNVVGQPLRFPESPTVSFAAKELIRGLLVKEPQQRLAYRRGATEVKQHPFFQSVNWALIRCASPPEIPKPFELNFPSRVAPKASSSETVAGVDVKPSGNYLDIDFF